jgi:hypothetical protein
VCQGHWTSGFQCQCVLSYAQAWSPGCLEWILGEPGDNLLTLAFCRVGDKLLVLCHVFRTECGT